MLSAPTARFLLGLVNDLRPYSGAPDFEQASLAIIRAQTELKAIVEKSVPEPVE